jgi:3-isopropylmalate/(R)-2-methylmalate dehydratase large subunit
MVHEQLGGRIAPEYSKLGCDSIWDPSKVFFVLDHWVPAPTVQAAEMHKTAEAFADKYGFINRCARNEGICHQVLPEHGFAYPGRLIIGSDSHTTTYGAFNCFSTGVGATDVSIVFRTGKLWFRVPETRLILLQGELKRASAKDLVLTMLRDYKTDGAIYSAFEFAPIKEGTNIPLSVDSRMVVANMVQEMGAKCGIFWHDAVLDNWLSRISNIPPYKPVCSDPDSDVLEQRTYILDDLVPMVAKPHSPDNVVPVSEVGDVELDQVFIGSCTNGRLEDLRIAAKILKGKSIAKGVRLIVIPASKTIYLDAMKEGLIEIFVQAGAIVGYPTCGPCIGGHMGVLGDHEVCLSTSNRNFRGRMGSTSAEIYLASPEIAAKSAIAGKIVE